MFRNELNAELFQNILNVNCYQLFYFSIADVDIRSLWRGISVQRDLGYLGLLTILYLFGISMRISLKFDLKFHTD